MKAIFEFEFRDGIYGNNYDEDIPSSDYREMEALVDGIMVDAINRSSHEIYEEVGVNDLEYECVTNDESNKFSYVVSTGYPNHIAREVFDLIGEEIKVLLPQFKTFMDDYDLRRLAWKKYDDGEEVECPHLYETVSFLAVQSDIREIQTCVHCKESIAKLVRLV